MLSSKDIIKAHKVLNGVVVNTPLDYDHYLSEKYGAKIYLKKENAQRVRSFKIRGAYYAIPSSASIGNSLRMIPRRSTDYPTLTLFLAELGNSIIGTTNF